MEEKQIKSVFFHFRFKFLALTSVFFLLYLVLSGASSLGEFAASPQFALLGPYLVLSMVMYLIFRAFPIRCPECHKAVPTKKNWLCPDCGRRQGKPRFLMEKCLHCRTIPASSACDHCGSIFRL